MSTNEINHESNVPARRSKKRKQLLQALAGTTAGVLLFLTGWGIGNGRLTFDSVKTLNSSASTQLNYSEVDDLYSVIRNRYDGKLNEQQIIDGMLSGLSQATGDPYTEYFNAKDAEEFNQQLQGTIIGIGAQLGKSDDNYIEVVAPIEGSPASSAGLQPKDIISEVNGESTSGWATDKAVTKIRGKAGTQVTLTILRANKESFKVTITRAEITVPSVEHEILSGNIGYIKINQFSDDTGSLARKASNEFKKANVSGVVLDMRDNPGGLVTSAVDVASLWLPKNAVILQEKRDDGKQLIKTEYSNGNNPLLGIPTRVLINGGSASASEIVAGALKDHKAASLIGAKSYGKGSVQEIKDLSGGGQLKVTIARWYRPNGQNIDKKGISPDTEVSLTPEQYAAGNDTQKDAATAQLK